MERLPSSAGTGPLNRLSPRSSSITRPSSSVATPYHSPIGRSLSQSPLSIQFGPSVVWYREIKTGRSSEGVGELVGAGVGELVGVGVGELVGVGVGMGVEVKAKTTGAGLGVGDGVGGGGSPHAERSATPDKSSSPTKVPSNWRFAIRPIEVSIPTCLRAH